MKTCIKCGLSLQLSDFHKDAQNKDGLRNTCKTCSKNSVKTWQIAFPDKEREKKIRWKSENPERDRIHSQTKRARRRKLGGKLSIGLSKKLFEAQRGKCACCGLPLGDNYHLDHIMPLALGGANEDWNIQLLRQHCNNKKHAKHPIDFMQSKGYLL